MTVVASGELRRGRWHLRLDGFVCEPGVTAVVGPNGAGKTSMLRLIAGLEALDSGSLSIDGAVVDQPDRGVLEPAHRRPVAYVFQDHRLFPHLRIEDDVAFPLRRRGADRRVARRRARELLDRVGLADRATSRPHQLSGGQRQRVALARALATEPEVLLLDEPLASVDDQSRRELQQVLAEAPARTIVLVTHDPVEARTLARGVVVLDEHRVIRSDTLERVSSDPGTGWAAAFVGANVVAGRARGRVVATESGFAMTVVEDVTGPVHVTFPAHAVTLHPDRPEGSARNSWPATVDRVEIDSGLARVTLSGLLEVRADVTTTSAEELRLRPGSEVWASVKATELSVAPR